MSFDNCIHSCYHHPKPETEQLCYHRKSLCVPLHSVTSLQPLLTFISSYVFLGFHVNGVTQYVLCCVWVFSVNITLKLIYILAFVSSSFFLLLSSISLYEWNTVCLSICLLTDIWVIFRFWLWWVKVLFNINILIQVFFVDLYFHFSWVSDSGIARSGCFFKNIYWSWRAGNSETMVYNPTGWWKRSNKVIQYWRWIAVEKKNPSMRKLNL